MSKKEKFINFVYNGFICNIDMSTVDPDVSAYWNALCDKKDVPKKNELSDKAKLILKYLQTLPDGTPGLKSKDIADAIEISSRSVSGSMRKLVTEAYVEKLGSDPCYYAITEKGKNIIIED